jgi:hypothetical protein
VGLFTHRIKRSFSWKHFAVFNMISLPLVGRVAQSVQRLATEWTVRGLNPGGGKIFRTGPDRLWAHSASCTVGNEFFPGGKERLGRDADSSPTSSAVGHERLKLFLYSSYGRYGLYRA